MFSSSRVRLNNDNVNITNEVMNAQISGVCNTPPMVTTDAIQPRIVKANVESPLHVASVSKS